MSASDCYTLEETEYLSALLHSSRQLSETGLNERWLSLPFFKIPAWAVKYRLSFAKFHKTCDEFSQSTVVFRRVMKFRLNLLVIYSALRLSSSLVCICDVTCMALGTIPTALPHLQDSRGTGMYQHHVTCVRI